MNFVQSGKDLAKLETTAGSKIVSKVKDALISLSSDDQMTEFLDSYLETLLSVGMDEKEAKNYRSRVKAILKVWSDDEKRTQVYSHESKSIQLLAKFARGLGKEHQEETEQGQGEPETVTEKLMSVGDISAQLDRLAQHLHAHGKFEQADRILIISDEILETVVEPATI
jgi:hypothetical protein